MGDITLAGTGTLGELTWPTWPRARPELLKGPRHTPPAFLGVEEFW